MTPSRPGIHSWRSIHKREIPPEVFQALRATEERGEMGHVQQHDVSSALLIWRHPEQTIELRIAGCGERMWTIEINRLAREQMYRFVVLGGDLVVRQVRMEIQRRDIVEQSQLVKSRKAVSGAISFVPLTSAGRSP